MSVPYTSEELRVIAEMVNAGLTLEDCCHVLKSRTRDGIKYQVKRMGLKFKCNEPEIDFDAFKRFIKNAGKQKCL